MVKLNAKQRLFVKEYLIDKNATRAAKAAGYSKKTAYAMGAENLKKPQIKRAIDIELNKQLDKAEITSERILNRLAEFAFKKSPFRKESDAIKACELLGKNKKLFTDVIEATGKDQGPLLVITLPDNGRAAPDESNDSEPDGGS